VEKCLYSWSPKEISENDTGSYSDNANGKFTIATKAGVVVQSEACTNCNMSLSIGKLTLQGKTFC
jgi:hypothetical protein